MKILIQQGMLFVWHHHHHQQQEPKIDHRCRYRCHCCRPSLLLPFRCRWLRQQQWYEQLLLRTILQEGCRHHHHHNHNHNHNHNHSWAMFNADDIYVECISAEGSGEDNEVEILDNKIATSTTSDVDVSNTIDVTDAAEVGNNVNAEEEEEYPESYFVLDDEEPIVIIEEVDDNIIKTTIAKSNNDTTTTTTTVVVVLEEEGMMAEEEEDKDQLLEDEIDHDNGNCDDTNNTVIVVAEPTIHSPTNAPTDEQQQLHIHR
mmetsp:Transcript_10625/g.12047  ORF Transcript_10625/g.12047 Transcript_10625/m.12047 type:complete len:259 (-) Transcript_10625:356-1132(-)